MKVKQKNGSIFMNVCPTEKRTFKLPAGALVRKRLYQNLEKNKWEIKLCFMVVLGRFKMIF